MEAAATPPTTPAAPPAALVVPPCVTVAGNELTIFVESPPLIEAMVRDIRQAQRRVWLEIYIFAADAAGRAIAEALQERARAGLDVRVLYDAIGSQSTPSAFFRSMTEAGVRVHCFHSLWEAFTSFSALRLLNRRNHRKLLVVDDRVAYFGGMNIIDQSRVVPAREVGQVPSSTGWRDVHVRLAGPKQAEVSESFHRSWLRALGKRVPRRPLYYRQALLAPDEEAIQFFDSGPGLGNTRAGRVIKRLIGAAQQTLLLSMAYFLPVGGVLRELMRAHRRGVFIRVVVPGVSDVAVVQHATRHLYGKLLRRRFHIYERQVNMLHSKVLIVDDRWTLLGSCNLDARSLYINLEFLAVIHSRKLAATMRTIVQYEIEHSRRITLREVARLKWWQRLIDRVAWSLRWWL